MRRSLLALSLVFVSTVALGQGAPREPIRITADLSDAPRKLFHAEIDIPVKPGAAAFLTPQWIPGTHSPTGPAGSIVGVVFTAGGKTLPWRRDDVNLYEFHVTVPAGVHSVHAHLDSIVQGRASTVGAVLEWEALMMYPAGVPVREILIQPSVIVPVGWGIGTSLKPLTAYDPAQPPAGPIQYQATTVEMLEDSPILTGKYFHEYALAPDVTPGHFIDVVGAARADVQLRPEVLTQLTSLVHEGFALYGPPHYTSYHFLLTLPAQGGGGGLEHHESSDNSAPEHSFETAEYEMVIADILPHEFTHSWNGKYRRPAGLATSDYSIPMKGELLWVYEGLTDYLGGVLAARIGALTPAQFREKLALTAATMDATGGRAWRSTEDTAIGASIRGAGVWANWRRGSDYYPEGDLVWLDADTTIRKLTDDKKSLRDFLQIFLQKGGSGVPRVLPYGFDELTADLNQVVKYDWTGFFQQRVMQVQPHVNTEGIEQGGYKLVYTDKPTSYQRAVMTHLSAAPERIVSLGLSLGTDGTINDLRMDSPADKAKLAPGQKIIAINGRSFSTAQLHAAIVAAQTGSEPIHLMVEDEGVVLPVDLDYHEGEKYPSLLRVDGTPDYLDEIATPLTAAPASQAGAH